ncbi:MAG: 2-oxoacid:acceptor oxidoreductase family protein [Pseudomonadota bacterium]|nr:2-oxoacid:acceptor oxidoreductase family protein [Pseudomonadota bacterium]
MALKRRKVDFKRDFEFTFNGARLFDREKYVQDIKAEAGSDFAAMGQQHDFIGDGNNAAVNVLKRTVTGLVGYPITPSTPIAEGMAKAYADGFVNAFGERIFYFQPESELGAMAFLEGAASQGGRYADNTSSQGLTYKYKNMYSVAGKRLPVVMTMQTRELNKGGLSIHNGHADLYAARGAGWLQFMSADNQELHHLIPLAFKAIEQRQVMLPAIVAGEGFQKSHSIENIKIVSDQFLKYFLGEPNRLFQPDFDNPVLMGTFTDIGTTMSTQMKQDLALLNAKKYVKAAMGVMNAILGTSLDVVEDYYASESEYVIVCLGAAAGTMKEAVDYYRSKGVSVGLLRPVLFFPVCTEELARGIQNAKVVSVLEKTALANERYLLRDVKHAAYNERTGRSFNPVITSGIYGLGSQDFSIEDCFAVIENMLAEKPMGIYGVGIKGPQVLEKVVHDDFVENEVGVAFVGVGAEGVKTAQETLAKIIAKAGKYVQTSAKYGASRKGGMVVMNARVATQAIRNCSDVSKMETLAVFNDKYLLDNSLLGLIKGVKSGGYLVVNTVKSFAELVLHATSEVRVLLEKAVFNLVLLDATGASLAQLKRNLPGTPILGAINRIIELLPVKAFNEAFRSELASKFTGQKAALVDINMELLEVPYELIPAQADSTATSGAEVETVKSPVAAGDLAKKIYYDPPLSRGYHKDDEFATLTFPSVLGENYRPLFIEKVLDPLQKGEDISWDQFYNIVPARTSEYHDASLIGTSLPVFAADKCIACGLCIAACPDNALRVSVVHDREYEDLAEAEKKLFRPLDLSKFTGYGDAVFKDSFLNINVMPQYCKGCGACVEVCKTNAFSMVDKSSVKVEGEERFLRPEVYEKDVSPTVAPYVKDSRYLQQLMLLYSGQKFLPGGHTLCPGCGEGIIENLVFAAAEMVRRNPRLIADFYRSIPTLMTREHGRGLQHMIDHGFNVYTVNATGCAEVSCLGNPYNARVYPSGHYGFGTASAAGLGARVSLFNAFRNLYLDKLTKVLVFGGDGSFYDIGNQGLNFALGEDQDVTWIIYNNEAYMNTGFQKSGASRFGSNRTTSPYGMELQGKDDFHREIVGQAMVIPGVYVARLSLSNPMHAMRILTEAIAYKGPSLIEFFSPCPTGQGMATDDLPIRLSKMMVDSRAWTVFTRKPYAQIDLTGNPDPEETYPKPRKVKGKEVPPTTFRDIVALLGQFTGDEKTINEIVKVNERQNLYLWCLNQYRAGIRQDMPDADEIERLISQR